MLHDIRINGLRAYNSVTDENSCDVQRALENLDLKYMMMK